MEEILLVNHASSRFEAASGCKLHRDPASLKCKLLPLGKWRNTLKQDDLPQSCAYMIISDPLDMVGVELRHTWTQTRKVNGDLIQSRVANTINPWKAGKFMPVTMRPWSINSYGLSKAWFIQLTFVLVMLEPSPNVSRVGSMLTCLRNPQKISCSDQPHMED